MRTHSFQKLPCNWVPRSGPDDRVDGAIWTQGRLTVVNPVGNFRWRKDCQAIEASTNLALFQFGPIRQAVPVRRDVVGFEDPVARNHCDY